MRDPSQPRAAPRPAAMSASRTFLTLVSGNGFAYRRDGLRDDRVDTQLPQFRRGPAWITVDPVGTAEFRARLQLLAAHHARHEGQGERRVRERRVGSDLLG